MYELTLSSCLFYISQNLDFNKKDTFVVELVTSSVKSSQKNSEAECPDQVCLQFSH